jgi:hypothetical protein
MTEQRSVLAKLLEKASEEPGSGDAGSRTGRSSNLRASRLSRCVGRRKHIQSSADFGSPWLRSTEHVRA